MIGLPRARVGKLIAASWGSIAYSVLQAITLAVIARRGGAEDTGLFLLAQAIATPAALFLTFRLRDQIASSVRRGLVPAYLRRQLLFMAPALVIGSVGWFLFADRSSAVVGSTLLIANFSQSLLRTVQGALVRSAKFSLTSAFDAAYGLLSLVSVAIGYAYGGLPLGMALTALSWGIATLFIVIVWSNGDWGLTPPTTAKEDIVMGLSYMGAIAQISLGRLGTSIILGQAALARVGSSSFVVRATHPVFLGVLKITAPRLAQARAVGHTQLRKVEKQITRLAIGGAAIGTPIFALLGWIAGPWCIELAFGPEVVPSAATAAVVFGSAPMLYASMALSQLLVARGDGTGASRVSFSAMVATAVCVLPLAVLFGEPGAASSIFLGYLTRCVTAVRMLQNDDAPTSLTGPAAVDAHA